MKHYVGRFAPSPTGPLHIGSLVAALASYLDAKVHNGLWYLRIEDNDFDRNQVGAAQAFIHSLQRCGMHWDGEILYQSQREAIYETAFQQLGALIYPCACSRKEILDSQLQQGQAPNPVYPGTCRDGLPTNKSARSFRLRVPDGANEPALQINFTDRFLGPQQQNLSTEVGDFILKRADGFWAYQLAVVVDDAAQGVTDIVRGADLLDSTVRQIYLQRCLGLPTPRYLHVPVITNQDGEKLSKQTGAMAFDLGNNDLLQTALLPAAEFLGLKLATRPRHLDEFWALATMAWAAKINALPTDLTS